MARCGSWHASWQREFDRTEVVHLVMPGGYRDRRADAMVPPSLVVEFQHSYISAAEVVRRGTDYRLHQRDLVWVLDGGVRGGESSVDVIDDCKDMFYMYFRHRWMYESFLREPFVYVDVSGFIYQVSPAKVVEGVTEVSHRVCRDDFLVALRNNANAGLWPGVEHVPTPVAEAEAGRVFWKQRGAGNGKTYESVQLLEKEEFAHKNVLIYLTKVHSARETIFQEFVAQAPGMRKVRIRPDARTHSINDGKAHRIPFVRENGETGVVYIGTVDSFTYNMCGRVPQCSRDLFLDIVKRITEGSISVDGEGQVVFKKNKVCRTTLVIIDEAQDLPPEYVTAMAAIMRKTGADVALIGDKLQSIWGERNVYTFMEKHDLGGVDVRKDVGENRVLRFHNPRLVEVVNAVVPFGRFGLPPIAAGCDRPGCALCAEHNDEPAVKLGLKVDEISSEIMALAKERGYVPADFAVIAPIIKGQNHLCELERAVNQMWLNLGMDEEYMRTVIAPSGRWGECGERWRNADHCYMHQSEEGRPIDLSASRDATRILSIHASKGTGTRIVFVVDLSEANLVRLAGWGSKGGLQYESFLHVAVTRQKKRLYMAYSKNPLQDDIYTRFARTLYTDVGVAPVPREVPAVVSYRDVMANLSQDELRAVDDELIDACEGVQERMEVCEKKFATTLVDDEHHVMRSHVFRYMLMNQMLGASPQLKVLSRMVREIRSVLILDLKNYRVACSSILDSGGKGRCVFPVLKFVGGGGSSASDDRNVKNAEMLKTLIKSVVDKVNATAAAGVLPRLCPLETLVFLHVVELLQTGRSVEFRPTMIYRLLRDCEHGLRSAEVHGPDIGCPCRKMFPSTGRPSSSSLAVFHESANHAKELYQKLVADIRGDDDAQTRNININVLYNHKVYMASKYDNTLRTTLTFVVEVPELNKVVALHVVPTLTSLNLTDKVSEIMFASGCMANPRGHKSDIGKRDNRDRFQERAQEHYIMSMNNRDPVKVCFDGIVDHDKVLMRTNSSIQKEYTRFVHDVVRFRESSRDAFEDWVEKITDEKVPLVKKIKMRAYAGETLDNLIDLIPP